MWAFRQYQSQAQALFLKTFPVFKYRVVHDKNGEDFLISIGLHLKLFIVCRRFQNFATFFIKKIPSYNQGLFVIKFIFLLV